MRVLKLILGRLHKQNQQGGNMALTTDPDDPRLMHGADTTAVEMAEVYLVLSIDERNKGFIRPVRRKYFHKKCETITVMGLVLAETYARQPTFYGATYCVFCKMHRPVGEFVWCREDSKNGTFITSIGVGT